MQDIGILLPRSSYYSSIGLDIMDGFRAGCRHQNATHLSVHTENIGFGAEKQECYRAAEQLLLSKNVPVVFAYVGHRTAQLLRPLFMAANRVLIVLDAGSHLPQEWPVSPNIFYHSLHNSLGAWLSAKLAFNDGHTKAMMSSCFYDGGYLHTHALAEGWKDQKGEIIFNHATGYKEGEFSLQSLYPYLEQYPGSCLLSLFSGEFAGWFYRDIKNYIPSHKLNIYTSPFGLEETMLQNVPFPGHNIKGIAAWSRKISGKQNELFLNELGANRKKANLFSLLGWEAAQIATKIGNWQEETENNIDQIARQLKDFSFESPRGKVVFHPNLHYSLAPMWEVEIKPNEKNNCCLELQKEITNVQPDFEKLASLPLNNAVSGWYNSYTCI